MKRVLVIGANSYIARNLIHMLSEEKGSYDIMLYDRAGNHADGIGPYSRVDMLRPEDVGKMDLDCDIIYMFTGKTGSAEGFENYGLFIDVNEIALLNLLSEYVRQGSRARIVFPSTRLVYKGWKGYLAEDAEKDARTIYAANKWACENYLRIYHRVYGVQYSIFRICIPYGTLVPGASSYGTAEFMLEKAVNGRDITLYGAGEVRRTLTYIGDLCWYLINGGQSEECLNDVFNIGGEDYSLWEMASLITSRYGTGIVCTDWPEISRKIESGDTVFNASKLEKILGKHYKVTFRDWCERK